MDLPDSNPKTRCVVTKPGIADIPPVAILVLGQGMTDGKEKYGRPNWREHEVTASVYYNAIARHLMSWWDGEQCASDSGVHHLGHAMASAAILVDAEETGKLIDDRPSVPGTAAEFIARMTKPMDDGLCQDEGCLHHGTPHICVNDVAAHRTLTDAEFAAALAAFGSGGKIPGGQRGSAAPEALDASATITHGETEDERIERSARAYAEEVALRVLSTSRLEDATDIILSMCLDSEEDEGDEDEFEPHGLNIEISEPTNLQTYVIGIDTEEPPAAVQAKVCRFLRSGPDKVKSVGRALRHKSNPGLYRQMNARLPRPGQPADTVFIHHILARGTFKHTRLIYVLHERDVTQDRGTEAFRWHMRKARKCERS